MRPYSIALGALLLAAPLATAQQQQQPQQPPRNSAAADNTAALDKVLTNWEAQMSSVKFLTAELARIEKDATFNRTKEFHGYAQYMKSGEGPTALNLANLEMKDKSRADAYEKFVCTGTYFYAFSPEKKEITAYEIPKPKPGSVADDNFMAFLFGMRAADAKKRYAMKLSREDEYYFYIDITPRLEADQGDFVRAQVVIDKRNYMPRQLWFQHSNKNETTWDVPRIDARTPIKREVFDKPTLPSRDWKMVTVKPGADAPPKVFRP